ncbi:SusE domain-containing protein [Flavobacterium ustbae]|uniref:SusE domain-containing protein n=1 Tax=Flavobacterium ustbae TaxID=2488790 RepID=UPI000F7B7891|nr:SusE domain-containing protein [Flavobacterium ustbae]
MKNIYKVLIAFIGVLTVSCNADAVDERPVLDVVTAPEITAPATGQTYVLEADKGAEVAAKFTWSAAKYSTVVAVNYTLLIDKKGGDFSAAKTLETTTASVTEVSVLVRDLNQVAIDLGGVPDVAAEYDVKIVSNVSGSFKQVSTGLITISVTPYLGRVDYEFTDWYLIGAAVAGGWDNNVDTPHQPMFRDGKDATKYKFTGYFKAGNFKLISEKGSWASQLGRADDSSIEIKDNAGEFTIPADGYYTLEFNTKSLKYTLEEFKDAAAIAKTYTSVDIIGSVFDPTWSTPVLLDQSSFNKHVYSKGPTSLGEGEAKFRANNSWDVSWGGNTAFSGGGTGDNIPVAKSTYVIYFNDLDGSYLMIPNQ